MSPIPLHEWKWFGSAGHLIISDRCRFHLCTQVGKFLVSTVGEYVPRDAAPDDIWPGKDIGLNRKYETMVFAAKGPCMRPDCRCGLPGLRRSELDFEGYNIRGDAAQGHLAMCMKWAAKELKP